MCDLAYVLWLERTEDRDALDAWLASEVEYVTINRDEQELRRALRLVS